MIGQGDTTKEEQLANAMSIFGGIFITAVASGVLLYFISDKLVDWMHGAEDNQHTEEQLLEEELEVTANR